MKYVTISFALRHTIYEIFKNTNFVQCVCNMYNFKKWISFYKKCEHFSGETWDVKSVTFSSMNFKQFILDSTQTTCTKLELEQNWGTENTKIIELRFSIFAYLSSTLFMFALLYPRMEIIDRKKQTAVVYAHYNNTILLLSYHYELNITLNMNKTYIK